jgi:hypothetical protein
VIDEYLGLVFKTAERGAVHDSVAIALKGAAQAAGRLAIAAASAALGLARMVRGPASMAAFRPSGLTRCAKAAV